MNLLLRIVVFVLLFPFVTKAQSTCNLTVHGKVFDAESMQPLPFATILISELTKGVACNGTGEFIIDGLCPGNYTFKCSFVGYKTIVYQQFIKDSTTHNFFIKSETTIINEVIVLGKKEEGLVLASQSQADVKGEDLVQVRGSSLGESLKSITGVYALQSGPSIFKPVIHGLHSNRILIFNNGVRLEGQQWGSEHAPEIDPFIATKLTVVKGASSVRYGSDAIGGVILVEPAALPDVPGVSGELNIMTASNNRMGVTSAIVQGALDKKLSGLCWRVQGTYRRAGNSKTADYYMENTGFAEGNFSTALGYAKKNFGGELYYSEFNARLGIFSGTHAESITDVEAAIRRSRPLTPSYFSYSIGRPYQQVKHDLFKTNVFFVFNNQSRLDAVFARQQNVRSEYDYVPLTGNLNPELYLRLITHTVDLIYKHKAIDKYTGTLGFNGITQGNVRHYQMLIPNFRNYGGGIFYMGKWTNERLTLEAGLRYDYRWLRAYTLDNNTAHIITPTWNFQNVTETIGSYYYINSHFSWTANIGTAWRAPTVNELLSQGVHQSAVAYEIGNPDLHSERAYTFTTSLHYHAKRFQGELGLYNNIIEGYIFLKPDQQFIHTIRGSYPTFTYTQVDARFRGIDLNATYQITDSLDVTAKVSTLYAWNKTIHDYLQLIPANRFETILRYGFGDHGMVKRLYGSAGGIYIAKQNRVPLNSDYTDPPPGYLLLNVTIGFSIPFRKHMMSIRFAANNLLNKAYRDYLDRFRYFTDEPGRNFTLRICIPF